MSLSASCLVVRNLLRSYLSSFGANEQQLAANCKIMPDERPAPNCGQEFIAVYGSLWSPADPPELYALHERFSITVALTLRAGDVPHDRLGEISIARDDDLYVKQTVAMEARIREINQIIHTNYVDQQAQFAAILPAERRPYEKLNWTGTDPWPKLVGPDHFHATGSATGLVWKTYFSGAPVMQGIVQSA